MGTERFNIVIPFYMEEFQLSMATRAKYFSRMNKIPKQYQDKTRYGWGMFEKKLSGTNLKTPIEYLIDLQTGERVIMNAKKVGRPNVKPVNGQYLWSSEHTFAIAKMKEQLMAFFMPFIELQLGHIDQIYMPAGHFLHLEFIFFYPVVSTPTVQDMDNHAAPYVKTFIDALQLSRKIAGDSPETIRGVYSRYINIIDFTDRRLEIKFHFCKNGGFIQY